MKQRLAILGSTGSIGVQTLDIVRENPDFFEVRVLTANSNWQRLAAQAREFDADTAVIADKRYYTQLRDALEDTDVKVYAGEEAVAQVAAGGDTDVAVNALVGYAGLAPTVAALGAGKKLALANKESLVVGGEYVMRLAAEKRAPILPIDSEHSAIFQCLTGEQSPVRRLIITCSGGALRDLKREELAGVTAEQALRHPQWEMGAKITPEIASCLYTGVATDTGCFRFSNTTAETHKAAAALIEAGADVERLNERLFESRSHARVIAERMALESLEFYYDDRCALICLTWDQIQAAGVAGAELEDLTSLPRSIEGVEVGLTLRQQKDGSFKISVRTGHDTNACNIARRLGGGGHPRAAGCEISGNPDNAKHAILEEVKKELDRADAEKEAQ